MDNIIDFFAEQDRLRPVESFSEHLKRTKFREKNETLKQRLKRIQDRLDQMNRQLAHNND